MKKLLCMCLIASMFMIVMPFGTALAANVVESVYDFTSLSADGLNSLIESGEIVVLGTNSAPHRSHDENGLTLKVGSDNNIDSGNPYNLFSFDGSGDYVAITKMSAEHYKSNDTASQIWNVHTGFAIYADKDNYLIFGIGSKGASAVVSRKKINGELNDNGTGYLKSHGSVTSGAEVWLKVEKNGNIYTCSYSLDGETYTPAIENYEFANDSVRLGIYSGSSSNNHGIGGTFKTLTITRPDNSVPTETKSYNFTTLSSDGLNSLIESGELAILGTNSAAHRVLDENGLRLNMGSNNNIDNGNAMNIFSFDGSGDYVAITKMSAEHYKSNDTASQIWNVHTGFAIYADKDNYLIFGIGSKGASAVVSRKKINGELNDNGTGYLKSHGSVTSGAEVWLKVEKNGNIYTCSYSLDGETYTPAIENYEFANDSARLGIYSGSSSNNHGIGGTFKTLTITRPVKEVKIDSVSVEGDGAISATINATYETTCVILFATYNEDGMIDLEIKQNVSLVVGDNDFTTERLKRTGTESVKVFVWDSIANLVPMCVQGEL